MTDNTAPERVRQWTLLVCAECGHRAHHADRCPEDRRRVWTRAERISVAAVPDLLRWLDEQYKVAVAEGEDEGATAYARVKAHIIEGSDTHE